SAQLRLTGAVPFPGGRPDTLPGPPGERPPPVRDGVRPAPDGPLRGRVDSVGPSGTRPGGHRRPCGACGRDTPAERPARGETGSRPSAPRRPRNPPAQGAGLRCACVLSPPG